MSVMVSTTRPISCLTLRSRVGVPRVPRKYFETTMFVASWDQNLGISTSRCSKTTSPFSLPMTADRSSHSISSNGSTPSREKYREYSSPGAVLAAGPDRHLRAHDSGVLRHATLHVAFPLPTVARAPPRRSSNAPISGSPGLSPRARATAPGSPGTPDNVHRSCIPRRLGRRATGGVVPRGAGGVRSTDRRSRAEVNPAGRRGVRERMRKGRRLGGGTR